ncbi:glycoside hydrolase family 3 protein [Collinsella provencensis]|uniref:glycoside hydrolase family 3 protein n=1 Tax=Collinsella provencensis TaxID=1937461 RepID=UPI001F239B27|nr:glycoside hydrolase family 3 protein [Collinsella provencensis]
MEQKVAQLFIVTPESLTGVSVATAAGDMTRAALETYPVGGLCYFGRNITGNQQLRDMLANTREMGCVAGAGIAPFLTIDEEGGPLVARVANSGYFDVEHFSNMADIGASGDVTHAAYVGSSIGSYLHEIGFNVDFAPDADVLTNPYNTVIGPRSFGSDPQLVADMVAAEVDAMLDAGVLPCIKHFPGHGDTAGDSHTGAVYAERSRADIEACEFLPFISGIEAGCPLVMVGHIETPNFAADGLPASLSKTMMTDVLRDQLGFGGVIVSDSFAMGAITENYTPADAAVRYFQAGGDMLLMPENLEEAYNGVLSAVQLGDISSERLDESLARILALKEQVGLLA